MASVIPCGPCFYDETHQNARKWCTSCEEGLCEDCEKNHKKTKTTRDHQLISIEDYRKIEHVPIPFTCIDHDKKLEWFCKYHDKALCVVCLPTEHRSCSDVIPIDVASTNSRQSTAISDLQEAIEVTLHNIQHCITSRNTTTKDIENQEKNIRKTIRETRIKIDSYLDELEAKLMQTLVSTTKTCKSKCDYFLQHLETQEEKLSNMKDQILSMKEFASDLQVFLGTRQLDKMVISEIESIKTSTDSLCDYKFNLVLNSDIQKLSNGIVKKFGELQVTEHDLNLEIKELKIEQAQMQKNVQSTSSVADIEIKLINKVNNKHESHMIITGCAILPNGHFLFANWSNKNILEYDEDGNYISSIQVSACPNDIAVIDSDRIAITYGRNVFFEIFNIRNSRVEKKKKVGGECQGLSQSDGKIYVNRDQYEVEVFDITGEKLRIFAAKCSYYISASNNSISCSNLLNNNVCCYDMKGKLMWKFHDGSLELPFGVANDRSGNVFVLGGHGSTSKNLLLIQNDGKAIKNLLNWGHNSTMRTVSFDNDKHTLLCCNEDGTHFELYKVLYK